MPKAKITKEEALAFHLDPTPGKWEVQATVPMTTQRDLSLAYSPGVAVPCEAIAEAPETAYDYTNKGNLVAVISNGTAVLGLGNLGALLLQLIACVVETHHCICGCLVVVLEEQGDVALEGSHVIGERFLDLSHYVDCGLSALALLGHKL